MPELPEVETIKRDLERIAVGKKIIEVKVYDGRVIRDTSLENFKTGITGKTVAGVSRRGKALILQLKAGGYLIVQPMMTGQLIYGKNSAEGASPTKSIKLTFLFSDGNFLNYNDHRLFGRLTLVDDLSQVKFFKSIGPEPLGTGFNFKWLMKKLKTHKMPIKSLLMNQNFIAGIGNIYASEILFHSRISPKRSARSLKKKEVATLHRMTTKVLKEAIKWRGTSMNTYRDTNGEKGNFINLIKVYGRENERCFFCKAPIKKIVQAGRSTFFCRNCQC